MKDPIVEEIRRLREEHAARFNYDLESIYADLKRLEAESTLSHVSLSPRLPASRPPSLTIQEMGGELADHVNVK